MPFSELYRTAKTNVSMNQGFWDESLGFYSLLPIDRSHQELSSDVY